MATAKLDPLQRQFRSAPVDALEYHLNRMKDCMERSGRKQPTRTKKKQQ